MIKRREYFIIFIATFLEETAMSLEHPGVDHAVVDLNLHAAGVRIVPIDECDAAVTDMKFLFPHEVVLTTLMGCRHVLVFAGNAPASLVAEQMSIHLRDVEHRAA